jgi:hypothetical protein
VQERALRYITEHPNRPVTAAEVADKTSDKRGSVVSALCLLAKVHPQLHRVGAGAYRWNSNGSFEPEPEELKPFNDVILRLYREREDGTQIALDEESGTLYWVHRINVPEVVQKVAKGQNHQTRQVYGEDPHRFAADGSRK